MIELVVGVKGTGKTRALVDKVNEAAKQSEGHVVCIVFARTLTYNIDYSVRLVDAADYKITNAESLYGFVCGMLSSNYDITELFIDSALKICGNDINEFEKFLEMVDPVLEKGKVCCFITASMPAENTTPIIAKYIK